MADLPTNYLDDILAVSMGGKRKFKITHENGSTEEVTIEDISDYDQVGSAFGAGDINRTNQAVNEKFDSGDVVDPMLTTEEGFAADAYKTKLQFDEQNKNLFTLKNVTVLADNTPKGIGEYILTDDINNYKLIVIVGGLGETGWRDDKILVPLADKESYFIIGLSDASVSYRVNGYLKNNKLYVLVSSEKTYVYNIYGIK